MTHFPEIHRRVSSPSCFQREATTNTSGEASQPLRKVTKTPSKKDTIQAKDQKTSRFSKWSKVIFAGIAISVLTIGYLFIKIFSSDTAEIEAKLEEHKRVFNRSKD